MKRITALILTCLLSVGLLCGCGAQQPEPALPEIIIGSDTYPPYVYLDDNGDPTGIDVEIATEAFRRMGYQAVFTTIDWEQKKTLVDSGEIDCIWGCFSMSGRSMTTSGPGPYAISRQMSPWTRAAIFTPWAIWPERPLPCSPPEKPEDCSSTTGSPISRSSGPSSAWRTVACSTPRWTAAMWTLLPP